MHKEPHPHASRIVKLKNGIEPFNGVDFSGKNFRIEDWWDCLADIDNPDWRKSKLVACVLYSIRSSKTSLPIDNEVVYGKLAGLGHLIHVSELEI